VAAMKPEDFPFFPLAPFPISPGSLQNFKLMLRAERQLPPLKIHSIL
jgi:hypothetical protein